MKTITTPLPVTSDSVIESDYNEQTPNRRRKKMQHRKRSNHKHYYEDAWVEEWRYRYLTSTYDLVVSPIGYCPLCGRVSAPNYILVGLTSSKTPDSKPTATAVRRGLNRAIRYSVPKSQPLAPGTCL